MGYISMSHEDHEEIANVAAESFFESDGKIAPPMPVSSWRPIHLVLNHLRWTGHCVRMSDSRLPRQVLFVQLTHAMRTRGGQRKRFKDTAKDYMKKHQININTYGCRPSTLVL